ncbi:MAG TPA: glycosyltransferase family 4 protein [Pontiella sp.]|nr:glycosyltransferase family 4 protein [Pontiella sp.]
MKIIHVMRRFVPEKWGGTECVVFHLSCELIGDGCECCIHCTSMLSVPGRDAMEAVPVKRHRYVLPWLGLSRQAKNALCLKGGSPLSLPLFFALLCERRVSLIHTHVQHRLGGMARTAARLRRIPYVVSLHGDFYTMPSEQIEKMTAPFRGKPEWGKVFGALFGSRRVLEDADGIICVGRAEYEALRERFPAKPVFHVPNGVDTDRFSTADGALFRTAQGFSDAEKIVLCVSRIDYQKNQLGLLRAFSLFSADHPDHRLVLVGPVTVSTYRDEIMAERDRMGLADKVRIIEGLLPTDPMLPSAYKAAEQFVLPSLHEPFGIVVLEAWAAGLPVLASRRGGMADFAADRQTALLVDPESEEAMARSMAELADDKMLRSRLSCNALEAAADHGWAAVADRIREIYAELIRNQAARR